MVEMTHAISTQRYRYIIRMGSLTDGNSFSVRGGLKQTPWVQTTAMNGQKILHV